MNIKRLVRTALVFSVVLGIMLVFKSVGAQTPSSVPNNIMETPVQQATKIYKNATEYVRATQIGKIYYVSPNGTDSGDGSKNTPWKTISYAISSIEADKGNIIMLAEGTFVIDKIIDLKSGISIKGAGVGKTILKSVLWTELPPNSTAVYATHDLAIMQGKKVKNIELCDITFDGDIAKDKFATHGIILYDVANVVVHDFEIHNFSIGGLWFDSAENIHVYNGKFFECGTPTKSLCTGALIIGYITNSTISNCYFKESKGAYGIKGLNQIWNFDGSTSGIRQKFISNVKIFNIVFDLRKKGGWGNGQPNIDIELWNANYYNMEIFNCNFPDNISVPGYDSAPKEYSALRIYNNRFVEMPGDGYTFFIECTLANVEVDHNLFDGGLYPIASFASAEHNQSIHDNAFYNQNQINIINYPNMVDVKIKNNIVINKVATLPFIGTKIDNDKNVQITNNILYSINKYNDKPFHGGLWGKSDYKINNNLFGNWAPEGTGVVNGNPLIMDDYKNFKLDIKSPARAMGIQSINIADMGIDESYPYIDKNDKLKYIFMDSKNDIFKKEYIALKTGQQNETTIKARSKKGYPMDISMINVAYESENPDVATIDASGKITAITQGVALVKAIGTQGDYTVTSSLYVLVDDYDNSIVLRLNKAPIELGKEADAYTMLKSKFGSYMDITKLAKYSSSDTNIFTVDERGNLKTHNIGNAKLYCTYNGMEAEVDVFVVNSILSNIKLSSDKDFIFKGNTGIIESIITMSDGNMLSFKDVNTTITVEDDSILSATKESDNTISVIGLEPGKTKLTVKVEKDGTFVLSSIEIIVYPNTDVVLPEGITFLHVGGDTGVINYDGESYNIKTNGVDLWDKKDSFAFVGKRIDIKDKNAPDVIEVSVEVEPFTGEVKNQTGGVMIRGGKTADAAHVSLRVKPDGNLIMSQRTEKGLITTYAIGDKVQLPTELKLIKNGDLVTPYYKKDGEWKQVTFIEDNSKMVLPESMGSEIYAGAVGLSNKSGDPYIDIFVKKLEINTSKLPAEGITIVANTPVFEIGQKDAKVSIYGVSDGRSYIGDLIDGGFTTKFESLNNVVLTVDQDGNVTPKSRGIANVRAEVTLKDGTQYINICTFSVGMEIGKLNTTKWIAQTDRNLKGDVPKNIYDSNPKTRFCSGEGMFEDHYLSIDFGGEKTFNRLILQGSPTGEGNGSSAPQEILISNDGFKWDTICIVPEKSSAIYTNNSDKLYTAKYLKIVNKAINTAGYWAVYEFSLFNDSNIVAGVEEIRVAGKKVEIERNVDTIKANVGKDANVVKIEVFAQISKGAEVYIDGELCLLGYKNIEMGTKTTRDVVIKLKTSTGTANTYTVTVVKNN